MKKEQDDREIKIRTIANSKGEPQTARIEIPIEGGGGELGMHAVTNLVALIKGFKNMKTKEELKEHICIICGYAACCRQCGFLTEKSAEDIMQMAEDLADNELKRINTGNSGV